MVFHYVPYSKSYLWYHIWLPLSVLFKLLLLCILADQSIRVCLVCCLALLTFTVLLPRRSSISIEMAIICHLLLVVMYPVFHHSDLVVSLIVVF